MPREPAAAGPAPQVWVTADYHFPSTYSCRIPMSSMSSAPVMPAPGPATVRLALIKAGIECFELDATRDELFPILRQAPVRIRPPERVAISQHLLRGYKWNEEKVHRRIIQESLIVREMAHASGSMTVSLLVPENFEPRLRVLLRAVGYWGQSSSLTCCLGVTETPPIAGESALPLTQLNGTLPLRPYFSCLATEFRTDRLSWKELVTDDDARSTQALRLDIYAWPMITEYRQGTQKVLARVPLPVSAQ